MAKDPAFLFYPNDYIGGTIGMTFEEKGAYVDLLMMQFNRGHMTSHMIGQVVGQLWDKLSSKFVQDGEGNWYNQRLEQEIERRKSYCNSRLNNKTGKNQHTSNVGHMTSHTSSHMIGHMENVNINRIDSNKKGGVGERKEEGRNEFYDLLLSEMNRILGKSFRGDAKSRSSFAARIKDGFTVEDMISAVKNYAADPFHRDSKYKHITPEFITRADKLDKGMNMTPRITQSVVNSLSFPV